MPDTNPMYLIFATDDNYSQHLAVTIQSLLDRHSDLSLRALIILIEVSEENTARLQKLCSTFPNLQVEFKKFSPDTYPDFPTYGHISWAAYARIFTAHLLDESIEKVLYLDCDLLICDDLRPLWNTDISEYALAGVENPMSDRREIFGIPASSPYINTGVILMNLKWWREHDAIPQLVQYIRQNGSLLTLLDQDAINAVLHPYILRLPYRWNVFQPFFEEHHDTMGISRREQKSLTTRPAIVHFTGFFKPWQYSTVHPYQSAYWQTLGKTPYSHVRYEHRSPKMALKKSVRKLQLAIKRSAAMPLMRRFSGRG